MKLLLKKYRELAGMTQQDLADKTGIPLKTLQDWEQTGRSPRDMSRLVPIANALNCTVDNLLNRELPPNAIRAVAADTVMFPVYGRIAAGAPIEMVEAVEQVGYFASVRAERPYSYFLIVTGDSMNNEVLDGSYALIDPSEEVHNGDTVAVNVNGYDATLKVYHRTANSVILSPNSTNPEHKDLVIDETSPDAPNLRILGKKVGAMYPER